MDGKKVYVLIFMLEIVILFSVVLIFFFFV